MNERRREKQESGGGGGGGEREGGRRKNRRREQFSPGSPSGGQPRQAEGWSVGEGAWLNELIDSVITQSPPLLLGSFSDTGGQKSDTQKREENF